MQSSRAMVFVTHLTDYRIKPLVVGRVSAMELLLQRQNEKDGTDKCKLTFKGSLTHHLVHPQKYFDSNNSAPPTPSHIFQLHLPPTLRHPWFHTGKQGHVTPHQQMSSSD